MLQLTPRTFRATLKSMARKRDRNRSGAEQLIGSLTFLGVLAILYFAAHGGVWLLIAAAFCIPAVVRSVQRIAAERRARLPHPSQTKEERDNEATKEILQVARRLKGIVTPTLVTLETSLSLEEAEKMLQEMSSKGYASMNVTESGRIEYEFPEFLDKIEEHREGDSPQPPHEPR